MKEPPQLRHISAHREVLASDSEGRVDCPMARSFELGPCRENMSLLGARRAGKPRWEEQASRLKREVRGSDAR